ncbi:hypothetical protein L6452_32026 [Arctium lappa]|uniref:Uncharacterized protein n=1 Tax=Arctium lappa TaxID=4217 RepID=A0ACB8Z7N7_ARCLA|nr:hypothetical protein L6452_32026 [Arctium lappa]
MGFDSDFVAQFVFPAFALTNRRLKLLKISIEDFASHRRRLKISLGVQIVARQKQEWDTERWKAKSRTGGGGVEGEDMSVNTSEVENECPTEPAQIENHFTTSQHMALLLELELRWIMELR